MATVVTADQLAQFAQNIGQQRGTLDQIEKEMSKLLNGGFLWNDLTAQTFRASYERNFAPLRSKLFPAMERYQTYLKELEVEVRKSEEDKISI